MAEDTDTDYSGRPVRRSKFPTEPPEARGWKDLRITTLDDGTKVTRIDGAWYRIGPGGDVTDERIDVDPYADDSREYDGGDDDEQG